jgi:CHAT domain-containing protein
LDVDSRQEVWDALIRSRAIVLDEMASRHRTAIGADDPALLALIQEVASARSRLANLTLRGPDTDKDLARYRRILEAARGRKERAEQALAEKSLAFRREQGQSRIGYAEVTGALPPGAVLIAYAVYREPRAPGLASTDTVASEKRPSYLVLIMRADGGGPAVVPLGPAGRIDELVGRWTRDAGSAPGADRTAAPRDESRFFEDARALKRAVWDPLAPHIRDARVVFVVPDGSLHLLNIATLPGAGDTYLIESGPTFHYLSAERDLVPHESTEPPARGLFALGSPAFDEPSLFAALSSHRNPQLPGVATTASEPVPGTPGPGPDSADRVRTVPLRPFRGERSGCSGFVSMHFGPLPSTEREIQEIVSLWRKRGGAQTGVTHLTGPAASEAAFKAKAPGHQVLHIATHGFFLGGRCTSALDSSRGIGGLKPTADQLSPPVSGENPLLLSGLALAGANHRAVAAPDEDDGILTAEEIGAMDLSGVEWAVLSACETGVGEVKAGEGVFGLRRAFQVAGARTVIMSLWPVEDRAAQQWMGALYEGRLLRKLGTVEAVREASLKVLHDRRAKGGSTHPFFWGAFVAAGDWR